MSSEARQCGAELGSLRVSDLRLHRMDIDVAATTTTTWGDDLEP
jgi:hypothetical protein